MGRAIVILVAKLFVWRRGWGLSVQIAALFDVPGYGFPRSLRQVASAFGIVK